MPVHYVMVSSGGRMTGFDYNLWADLQQSKSSFVATLKKTLDLRYNGNRAPFCFGGHTDYYSEFNEYANNQCNNSTWQQRREAVEEFIDYALQKPDVRFVTSVDIIKWMRYPIGLDATSVDTNPEKLIHKPITVSMLPNNTFQIITPEKRPYSFSIISANGRTVYSIPSSHVSKNVPLPDNLSAGIYLYELRSAGNSVQGKFVLQ